MRLVIDTREQMELEFKDGVFEEVVRRKLDVGDYGCEIGGALIPVCFERKSLGDLFGTMTNGYVRFKAEMKRAKDSGTVLILMIEGSLRDVARGFPYSKFSGDAMLKKLAMLRVRHELEYHCFNDRREMARFIEEFYSAIARNYEKSAAK